MLGNLDYSIVLLSNPARKSNLELLALKIHWRRIPVITKGHPLLHLICQHGIEWCNCIPTNEPGKVVALGSELLAT